MKLGAQKQAGFTIVELLIVIVVIAILASIGVVAFGGAQSRARDSKRSSDIASLLKALESYKTLYGNYPAATPNVAGDYERSTDPEGTFMEQLTPEFFSKAPVDPVNDSTRHYRYYLYSASWLAGQGCPGDKGDLMVFMAYGFEDSTNKPQNDEPLVCTSRSWSGNSTRFFKYAFQNG